MLQAAQGAGSLRKSNSGGTWPGSGCLRQPGSPRSRALKSIRSDCAAPPYNILWCGLREWTFRDMAMINAELGQQLEGYVAKLVESGRYSSESEVLREGVKLVQDREMQLIALDAVIDRGIGDSETGRGKPAEDVFGRLEAKYHAMASTRR
ncbi:MULTISPECIES: type II toxin-antitoxin system ParD family antitoxin [Paraburkholderia]|nr:type II toxin-antitoxin system ParD family antitoxin [Paraburkholderia podalyriae]